MIHRLPIPTPFRVGRVNCYLIDDDPLTLVDVGPNSGASLVALEQALAEHGRRIEDLERIVITHQHTDHLGLVGIVADRSGADVCALDLLAPVVADFKGHAEANDKLAQALMRRHGIGADVVTALAAMSLAYRGWGGSAPVTQILHDGGELAFASRRFEIHHRPGHSPSDTIFYDPEAADLVAGDHLIKHISSNPLISRAARRALRRAGARPAARAADVHGVAARDAGDGDRDRPARPRRPVRRARGADRGALRDARAPRAEVRGADRRAAAHRARHRAGDVGQRRASRRRS